MIRKIKNVRISFAGNKTTVVAVSQLRFIDLQERILKTYEYDRITFTFDS